MSSADLSFMRVCKTVEEPSDSTLTQCIHNIQNSSVMITCIITCVMLVIASIAQTLA